MVIKTATITSASVVASSVAGRNIAKNMTPAEVTELGQCFLIFLFLLYVIFCIIFYIQNKGDI